MQTALTRGRVLVHPLLDMYASPPQSNAVSPEVRLFIICYIIFLFYKIAF